MVCHLSPTEIESVCKNAEIRENMDYINNPCTPYVRAVLLYIVHYK